MSGNASRKHKRYMQMLDRKRLYGDISARGDNGIMDLTAYSAARGEIIARQTSFDLAKITAKRKKKN
jgi:hypothetical protein